MFRKSCFVLIFAIILCQTTVHAKQVVRVRGRPRHASDQNLRTFSAVPAEAEAASVTTTTSEAATGECPEKEGLQVINVIQVLLQLLSLSNNNY